MSKIFDAINCSPESNFTQISNEILRDSSLSLKAKGLLCILLSNNDGWISHKTFISKMNTDGIDSIQSGLNELKEQGYFWPVKYVDKTTKRNRGSFWAYTEKPFCFKLKRNLEWLQINNFEIWGGSLKTLQSHYDKWIKSQKPEAEKPKVAFPVMAFPVMEIPVMEIPSLIIPILNNTNIQENQKEKTIGEVASQPSPSSLENENTSLDDSKQNKPSKEKESSKTLLAKANRVIKHFNKVTSQNIRLIASNQTPIIARLKVAGTTYKDCIKVIDKKSTHQWFVDSGHMCIETLFRPKNFEKYLNEDTKHYKDQKQSSTNKPSNGSGYTGTRKYKEAKVVKNVFTPWED